MCYIEFDTWGEAMRKIILIVLLLTQFGCSKQQISPIDSDIWGYDFNENQLSGSFSAMRNVTESEEGVFFYNTHPIE